MLTIEHLSISFKRYKGLFSFEWIYPVRDLSLSLKKGELMAVIGESGAGKSLMLLALLGLLPGNARVQGKVSYRNRSLTPDSIRPLRGKEVTFIPQNVSFLNPLISAGRQVERAACLTGKSPGHARLARGYLFNKYGLEDQVKSAYPFQISGGMARRVLCAAAVTGNPRLILADEPTTGLDPDNTKLSLNLLRELSDQGCSVLLITHDLKAVLEVADTIAVLKDGSCVETTDARAFKTGIGLTHPYSRLLYDALPENKFLKAVQDTPAGGLSLKKGCHA